MTQAGDPISLYLELVQKTVSGAIHEDQYAFVPDEAELVGPEVAERLRREGVQLIRSRQPGDRWIPHQVSMVPVRGLRHLERCVRDVVANEVPGDLIEAGVWKGGASILMRAALAALGDGQRRVFVADSFEGLPAPDAGRYPADEGDRHHEIDQLAVSLETVQANFRRFGLLDERVEFLKGWFSETLPSVRDRKWSVVRLDGDMYESTMDGLENLYPGLSVGGYLIIDDYRSVDACAKAVEDYRDANGISEPIQEVAPKSPEVFWKREA